MYFGTCTQRNEYTSGKNLSYSCYSLFCFGVRFGGKLNAQAELTVWLFSSVLFAVQFVVCINCCHLFSIDFSCALRLFALHLLSRDLSTSFSVCLPLFARSFAYHLILIDLTSNHLSFAWLSVPVISPASQNKSESNWRANAFMWTTILYSAAKCMQCNVMRRE